MFRLGLGAKPPTAAATTTSHISKQNSVDVGGFDEKVVQSNAKSRPTRSSSEPSLINMTPKTHHAPKKEYDNAFRDKGGFEKQSVEELQNYAAYKAEDTTTTVKNCLKIAEDTRDQGEETLVTLHQQGEQINRTHNQIVNIDHDLSRGEKILGSLGGMFSATWKPKKSHAIKGPAVQAGDSSKTKGTDDSEQREKLGLGSKNPGGRSKPGNKYAEPSSAMEKVEVEKAKQDDGLDDLSDLLSQMKGIAVDMGTELESQNHALDNMENDVDELNHRMKGANQRGRKLVGN